MLSSVIGSLNYDPAADILSVTFVSARTYQYLDVPPETAAAFKTAFAKLQFFNAHVRDRFVFTGCSAEEASNRELQCPSSKVSEQFAFGIALSTTLIEPRTEAELLQGVGHRSSSPSRMILLPGFQNVQRARADVKVRQTAGTPLSGNC